MILRDAPIAASSAPSAGISRRFFMKRVLGFASIVASAIFVIALAPSAHAQGAHAEAIFQRYLAHHPELASDPALFNDPAYMNRHPNLKEFLNTHPEVKEQARQMGAYDRNHVWRDQSWWHQNDPNWIRQNRPQWATSHPQWQGDGDYDDNDEWHNRSWWHEHRPDWAHKHHPDWAQDKAKFEEHLHEHEQKAEQKWEKHHPAPAPPYPNATNPGGYPPAGSHPGGHHGTHPDND
jgi:hypothetical protein